MHFLIALYALLSQLAGKQTCLITSNGFFFLLLLRAKLRIIELYLIGKFLIDFADMV